MISCLPPLSGMYRHVASLPPCLVGDLLRLCLIFEVQKLAPTWVGWVFDELPTWGAKMSQKFLSFGGTSQATKCVLDYLPLGFCNHYRPWV